MLALLISTALATSPIPPACGIVERVDERVGSVKETTYRMASPLGGLCAMSHFKSLDERELSVYEGPQSEATAHGSERLLWQGVYFVRFVGTSAAQLDAALQERSNALPNPKQVDARIARLSQLPDDTMIPGSRRFIPTNLFKHAPLGGGMLAEYGCGKDGMSLARIATNDARISMARIKSGAIAYPMGDEAYALDNRVIVMRVGDALAAVETSNGLVPACFDVVHALEGMMRSEQTTGHR